MEGNAFTVTVMDAGQPEEFVYVIIDVPAATPVTKPAAETVAAVVLEDSQGFTAAGAPEPVS
jgi:hypothetical protein